MFRLKIFKMIFLVMFFSIILNATGVMAQGKCFVPTGTKEVNFPEGWYDFLSESERPIVCDADGIQLGYGSSCDSIDVGDIAYVRVGGDVDLPTYNWSISGTGWYFLIPGVGTTTTTTSGSTTEIVQIYAGGSACGTGEVSVEDACENSETDYIRCGDAGGWQACHLGHGPDEASSCANLGPYWPWGNAFWPCSIGFCYVDGHRIQFILDCKEGYVDGICHECYCTEHGGDGWGMNFCPSVPGDPCYDSYMSNCDGCPWLELIYIEYWQCP